MEHNMNLRHDPFRAIQSGRKTIEMRLYDEKRARIQNGDTIRFTDVDTGETIVCTVIELYRYPSFEVLYERHPKTELGYGADEAADPCDMLLYYPRDEIERYGVVGIRIAVNAAPF